MNGRVTGASLFGCFAIVLLSAIALSAQAGQRPRVAERPAQVPNFAGTWVVVTPEDEAGQVKEVAQTATTLTTGDGTETGTVVYRLDGRGTREETRLLRENVPTVSTTSWEGTTLVITKETTFPSGRIQLTKQAWTLEEAGKLVIVYTQTVGAEELLSRTFTYKKSK